MNEDVGNPYSFMIEEKQKMKEDKRIFKSRHQQWFIFGLVFAIFALTSTLVYFIAKSGMNTFYPKKNTKLSKSIKQGFMLGILTNFINRI